jgi:hypothetical protein
VEGRNLNYGIALYDVFENSRVGQVEVAGPNVLICFVGNKKCESSDEFESLIKPYMEE